VLDFISYETGLRRHDTDSAYSVAMPAPLLRRSAVKQVSAYFTGIHTLYECPVVVGYGRRL